MVADIAQWHGDYERGPVVGSQRQRIAAKFHHVQLLRLHAGHERTLQRFGHEGVLLRAKISLRGAGAFAGATHGGQVHKRIAIAVHKIFQESRHLGLGNGIFHVIDQPGQS